MIMAVDTGLKNFGLSVFNSEGGCEYLQLIKTSKSKEKGLSVAQDMSNRITHITRKLNEVFNDYPIFEVVGELPTFGAKSSLAAVAMSVGATIILTTCELQGIEPKWYSPREIKKNFTGDPNASKSLIMKTACQKYNWNIKYKEIRTKTKIRKDPIYYVMGKKYGAGNFEHLADSIAAYHSFKIQEEGF